ncbi:amino acid permease/ SLC12A domain-containing protein [Jimgerdemannia flammicorona]|uniref:Amino acid permease/ SLC12A domain-containing protein n=1 Tax=Jimgerdemannia flammicorona TaxID=994334 RepID=A0A433Q9P4_9FUNG|nr:amino acid permease/ SLC12A domain-containing protein [Jimgerdemannia flammicorona]
MSKFDEKASEAVVDYAESVPTSNEHPAPNKLHRGLKARHIQTIAIGGTIGTGLFLASGKTISTAGPAGALIAYVLIGLLVYCVIMSLGEMAAYIPVPGGFNVYASRFVEPSLGFCVGWVYWANWAVGVAVELTGISLVMQYWITSVNGVVWAVISLAILMAINVFSVKGYGEAEYWFSLVKVLTCIAFIIVGILVDAGVAGDDHIGVRNWQIEGAPFNGGFLGVFQVFITAAFAFNGTEIVGITAGESENPKKAVPKAIKQVFWRILFFYVVSILVIGLVLPYNDPSLLNESSKIATSPFTLVFNRAGAPWADDLINAIILITVLSAGNSGLYSSSRTLMALAEQGHAPKIFTKVNNRGVPLASILGTSAVGCLAFLTSLFSSGQVFNWLTNLTSVAGLITWIIIAITHIRFRKAFVAQGRNLSILPYVAPFFPFADWFVIIVSTIVTLGQGYRSFLDPIDPVNIVSAYIGIISALVFYVGHKISTRKSFVPLLEADFDSGRLTPQEEALSVDRDELEAEGKIGARKIFWKVLSALA